MLNKLWNWIRRKQSPSAAAVAGAAHGSARPTTFTDLKKMRLQECDRPKCMAIELAKVGANVVATPDYDTLYVWPFGTPEPEVVAWHRDNNAGDRLIFHIGQQTITAEMPE